MAEWSNVMIALGGYLCKRERQPTSIWLAILTKSSIPKLSMNDTNLLKVWWFEIERLILMRFCLLSWYWNFEKELHKVRLNKFSEFYWNYLAEFRMNRSYTALPGTSGSRQPIYSVSRINWGRQPNKFVLKFANTFWTKCSCKK